MQEIRGSCEWRPGACPGRRTRELLEELNEHIAECDERRKQIVRSDEVVQRLCTAVGAGAVIAVSFVATVDRVEARRVRS